MRTTLSAALLGLLICSGAAKAAIVANGSFEDPFTTPGKLHGGQTFGKLNSGPGANWNVWDALPGWTTGSGYGIEVQSNRTLGSIDAQHGQHYVELDSTRNSSMFQDVLLGAGEHVLSFFYSPRTTDTRTNTINYSLAGLLNGTVSGPSVTTGVGQWTRITDVFNVAAAGTYRLSFAAAGTSDSYGGLLDDISIAPSPVPLPAGVLLLLSAAGALVASRFGRASA